jgi:tetratricopeptide (TPR) repeat protein
MRPRRFLACSLCAALVACAQPPQRESAAPEKPVERPPRVVGAQPEPREPPLPAVELTEPILFKMMLAEIAVQRGQPHVAVPAYLELARTTRDPRIAQRATEIAWHARFTSAALEAAGLWLQADPGSMQARQVIAALLVNQEKLSEARPHLEKWLASDPESAGQNFLQLNSFLARHKDKAEVLALVRALAQPYPTLPEARLAVAQAAWNAEEPALSLEEARAALKLRPDWELAALYVAQALQRRSNEEALGHLAAFLKRQPQAKDARLTYARLLVGAKRYAEARKQFEVLLAEFPNNAEVTMAVALLAMQAGDYDAAEAQLKRALELDPKDANLARLYLGQVNEERKRYEEALKWYASVGLGEQYVSAQARYAGILAKQGRLEAARRHLREASVQNSQQRVQLTQVEAQLLREASQYQTAFEVLGEALAKMPNHPDLLYDHALAAEKIDRLDILEANLRKLIQLRPDHAHAYNALGYTFADRNQRIEEAYQLIETALKLAPEDPFIQDSMGWVLYRMGRFEEGLVYLERAFAQRRDPEIAAHLGEVLWVLGRREQAKKVWADALKEHPGNEVLQATVKRFLP